MGKVIPFSKLESYLSSIKKDDLLKGTILDTNILISSSYEVKDSHDSSNVVLELIKSHGYKLYATVNTRSEFLEFQRRLILSENLLGLIDVGAEIKTSGRARAKIQTLKGSLKSSITADPERDEIFNDVQLKKIKKEFSAGPHSGNKGWLEICEIFLSNQIQKADQDLIERGIIYISPNDPSQVQLFNSNLDWNKAIEICENSGTAFNDSMILNALKSSKLFFIVTLDFDIGYAALSDPHMKDVVVPDKLAREFKNYHFPVSN